MGRTTLLGACLLIGCGGQTPQPVAPTATPPPSAKPAEDSTTMHLATSGDARAALPLAPSWGIVGTGSLDSKLGEPLLWHRHDPTGTCVPAGLGAFALKNEADHGADDRGVALFNQADGTILSFFTYPAHQSLVEEVRTVTDAMCQGAGSMSTELKDVRFADPGLIAGCFHESKIGPAFEQVLLFLREGWFYQARFTFLQGHAQIERQYQNAMAIVQTAFRPCAK